MREIRPEVEKWDIDNLLNRRDEVIINRLWSGHTWITHEYLINDIIQAGPEPRRFCNKAVKSVKHFITECEDLIIVRYEVFESEIRRNVFNMREMLTSASTLVKVLSFLCRVGLYELVWFENFVLWRSWWRPVALDVHLMWTQLIIIIALRGCPLMDSLRRLRCKGEP